MSTMMQAYPSKTFVDDEMKPLVSGRLTVYVHDSNVKASSSGAITQTPTAMHPVSYPCSPSARDMPETSRELFFILAQHLSYPLQLRS